MLAVVLHVLALAIALNVQSMDSPLAGAWLLFFLAGCAKLLYQGIYPKNKGALWVLCLLWAIAVPLATFVFVPVRGGATFMWVLIAAPMLAICMRREYLSAYLWGFGGVITLYAIGLIAQCLLQVQYTVYSTGDRYAWPLLDPNNGAAVINNALIPAVYLTIFHRRIYGFWAAILGWGMYMTGSLTGIGACIIACALFIHKKYGRLPIFLGALCCYAAFAGVCLLYPDRIVAAVANFEARYPIWQVSWIMSWIRPWTGFGVGTFGYFYHVLRRETYTAGFYAHNDLLQFACEMGWPVAMIFIAMGIAVWKTTWRDNLVSAAVLLALFIQAMMEFQFFVPPISVLAGLALAYHILNRNCSLKHRRRSPLNLGLHRFV